MGGIALTAAVIALGAAAVIRAKRRAHQQWLRRTGGRITGEAQGAPEKAERERQRERIAAGGGDPQAFLQAGGSMQELEQMVHGDELEGYPHRPRVLDTHRARWRAQRRR